MMKYTVWFAALLLCCASCQKTKIEEITVPASTGSKMQLNGVAGGEQGSAAANSVYVDFSKDGQVAVARASWDLGFYCGADFRVIINNTTAAMAKVLNETDMDAVNSTSVADVSFELDIANPTAETFSLLDDIDGDLSQTVIPEVSSVDAENKVIVLQRGTAGGIAPRALMKIRILRNATGGYTLHYAPIDATGYQTLDIGKDSDFNFTYCSFEEGQVSVEPMKYDWDMVWTMSIFKTPLGNEDVAYIFSDLVAINYLNGTQVAEKEYASAEEAATAFDAYNKSMADAEHFVAERWKIGSAWRKTAAPGSMDPGVVKTKFYLIKDNQSNYYKLRFLSFTTEDGGERGKPEIRYELLK